MAGEQPTQGNNPPENNPGAQPQPEAAPTPLEQERARSAEQAEVFRRETEEDTRRVEEQNRTRLREYRVGDQGGQFVLQNFGKKLLNFGGILEKRTNAAIERRQTYIAEAEARMAEEQAHYARCQHELEGRSGELNEYRSRMARLAAQLETVTDQATRDELQGYINHYDMLMVPLEDTVARMRHQMEYASHMVGAYDNQGEAFRALNARSAAYLQVLRTPFSSLWSRDTRVSVGNMLDENRVAVTGTGSAAARQEHERAMQRQTVANHRNRNATAGQPAAQPEAANPVPAEREPIRGEVIMEFNPVNYTAQFSRDAESVTLGKDRLFELYKLYVTSARNKREQVRLTAESIAADLSVPAEQAEYAKQSIKQSLETVLNRLLPEALEEDANADQAAGQRVRELKNSIQRRLRQIGGMDEGAERTAIQEQINQERAELGAIIDGLPARVGL